ncbi:MAG: hypothetical protein AAB956_04095 [Patescibacteria group bacterium]
MLPHRLQIVIAISIILALVAIPLAWSSCSQQSIHLGCSVGLECGNEALSALTHITTMTKVVANFLVSGIVAILLALIWFRWRQVADDTINLFLFTTIRLGEQGVNSYYRRLHPHDVLLESLPKIYRRHFARLSN